MQWKGLYKVASVKGISFKTLVLVFAVIGIALQ